MIRMRTIALGVWALGACAHPAAPTTPTMPSPEDVIVARVAAIHGGAGPFAVAGYRMGERALREVGAARGSFDAEVTHESPAEVQWSCIADGLQAATGTSMGRLNLHMVEVPREALRTIVRNRTTRAAVQVELRPEFLARYLETPRERLGAAGREVAAMPEDQIFVVRPLPAAAPSPH